MPAVDDDYPTIKRIVAHDVAELRLDPQNPRLPPDLDANDEPQLVEFFDRHYDLDEIAESMVDKGFFPQEPLLILVPRGEDQANSGDTQAEAGPEGSTETTPSSEGGLIVVEGNRRLATLKLLLNEELAAAATRSTHWREMAGRAGPVKERLNPIPTQEYTDRGELEDYLGFRHVTGVERWTAEAKARFVTQMVARGRTFQEAARKIGSRQDAVRRQVVTWAALQQAADAGKDIQRAYRFFGVFYRALQTQGIRQYVGLPDPREITGYVDTPVPTERLGRIEELATWLFGDGAELRPLFTDSRRLTDLGRILQDEVATRLLQQERDFNSALTIIRSDKGTIESALTKARSELVAANGLAFDFQGNADVINRADAAARVMDAIVTTLGEPSSNGAPDATAEPEAPAPEQAAGSEGDPPSAA